MSCQCNLKFHVGGQGLNDNGFGCIKYRCFEITPKTNSNSVPLSPLDDSTLTTCLFTCPSRCTQPKLSSLCDEEERRSINTGNYEHRNDRIFGTMEGLSLHNILDAFNNPLNEEQAWAICYQCARFLQNQWQQSPAECRLFGGLHAVELAKDGSVLAIRGADGESARSSLGCVWGFCRRHKLLIEGNPKAKLTHRELG